MRPRSSRHLRAASVATLALLMAAPVAQADPVPEPAVGSDGAEDVELHEHDHGHDAATRASLQSLGDPFAESLLLQSDPFVVPEDSGAGELVRTFPESPMDWVGPPPDPSEFPEEWLTEQPAVEVDPATPEELMSAADGYLGGGYDALGVAPEETGVVPAAVPAPPTKDLPSTLDAAPPWQYTYSCDPNNRAGMVAFANLVSKHYDRPTWWGSRACKYGDNSQHYEGRAFDWPMNAYNADDKAIGDAVAQWLTANNGEMARRFGVQSVIWNKYSWYLYKPGAWYPYYGPSPHTDHLHISFSWDGAMGRTSWWDGTPITTHDHGTCRVFRDAYAPRYTRYNPTPCPTNLPAPPTAPNPVLLPGARNDYVKQAQQALGFTGADVDGSFGPMTLRALLNYQANKKLPWTGVLDKSTWAHMISSGALPPAPPPPPPPPAPPAPDPGVSRVSGTDRYATAAKLSSLFPTGKPLYLTVGEEYPDALTAAARAGSLGAPVLLTKSTTVPGATKDAIKRLRPSRVVVVGGRGAIADSVLTTVRSLTPAPVSRVGGADRYATAGALARNFGTAVPVVYVATGTDYPDALAGAARAGYNDGPVLLTHQDGIPSETRRAMQAINPYRVVVLGGKGAVSDAVAEDLRSMTRAKNLQRVAGRDRYATASELARYYPNGLETVIIATGKEFPDALAGAARAGARGGPVLLVTPNSVDSTTRAALAALDPQKIVIVGGTNVVSHNVATILQDYVQ
ncbi:cell wall-binding repeat-containing protein [Ornithinimicrobium cavernae]|uniref:cell wall-binding repeat-containing protein n=1 Tax=Ornithinimicrobium cavernae TaxID=2666047 RepID=UPI000D698591|nr:cell wall-binding repeat-containing protein [Ornithinimicrobium cavernae]